jgi:phenylalanine-4-hydroxylase
MNVVNCSENKSNRSVFLPFDIEEVVKTRFDYSEIQDRYFIINSMEDLYHSFRNNKNLFMYEGK